VPRDFALTDVSLAQWYFGDGCLGDVRGYKQLVFATNGFSWASCERLVRAMKRQYGWVAHVNKGPVIRMGQKRFVDELLDVVRPFTPGCFRYKLGEA